MILRCTGLSFLSWLLCVLGLVLMASVPWAQIGTVESEQKISETAGGFGGALEVNGAFAASVAALGDLDGNGVDDLAVGGGKEVWILFLNMDGTVATEQRISGTTGGFGGNISGDDFFGYSVAALGDIDGDGVEDLAVGAPLDDDGGLDKGAVWILFLDADGTVASEQKISETAGGFGGVLDFLALFGASVAALGDLDGDGVEDLAVGAYFDNDGGTNQGAVWILFLNSDGTVHSEQKISETAGGFGGNLDPFDHFGRSVAALGDLNGDGVHDLAVGAERDDDGSFDRGAIWILFLNADGTVAAEQKISETTGGFGGDLDASDFFGTSVAALGDLDGDGVRDLAVGAHDDDGGTDQGAVWILFLNADGTVAAEQKISETTGGFGGDLDAFDFFGTSVAALGDLDGDGVGVLAVGATGDDDGGSAKGAVWVLFLEGPTCLTLDFETEDDFVTPLGNGQSISTPPEFGNLVRISGAGANAGPATFDTTPGGPNDPALNDDMLIGQGNVLLLEDDWYAFAQAVPGFFDVVTDDPDGGDLVFDFTSPVNPRHMLLADINPPPNQGASVTLSDEDGRTRVYSVEPGWTGTYGNAGPHELDLTTLAPQPGNGTPRLATAVETLGFEQARVVRLVVHLTGFGAIDELCFFAPNLARASATMRNGSGKNPVILASDSRPVLGDAWSATLDCSGTGSGLAVLELRALATSGTLTPFGEVLVDGALLQRTGRAFVSSSSRLEWQIPHDLSLLGLEVHAQGLCRGQAAVGTKTRAGRMVLSNAVDLVLGF